MLCFLLTSFVFSVEIRPSQSGEPFSIAVEQSPRQIFYCTRQDGVRMSMGFTSLDAKSSRLMASLETTLASYRTTYQIPKQALAGSCRYQLVSRHETAINRISTVAVVLAVIPGTVYPGIVGGLITAGLECFFGLGKHYSSALLATMGEFHERRKKLDRKMAGLMKNFPLSTQQNLIAWIESSLGYGPEFYRKLPRVFALFNANTANAHGLAQIIPPQIDDEEGT